MKLSLIHDVVKLAPPKRRIFKFELELKLDHQFCVEFRGDYDGDSFKSQKPNLGPLIDLN